MCSIGIHLTKWSLPFQWPKILLASPPDYACLVSSMWHKSGVEWQFIAQPSFDILSQVSIWMGKGPSGQHNCQPRDNRYAPSRVKAAFSYSLSRQIPSLQINMATVLTLSQIHFPWNCSRMSHGWCNMVIAFWTQHWWLCNHTILFCCLCMLSSKHLWQGSVSLSCKSHLHEAILPSVRKHYKWLLSFMCMVLWALELIQCLYLST